MVAIVTNLVTMVAEVTDLVTIEAIFSVKASLPTLVPPATSSYDKSHMLELKGTVVKDSIFDYCAASMTQYRFLHLHSSVLLQELTLRLLWAYIVSY